MCSNCWNAKWVFLFEYLGLLTDFLNSIKAGDFLSKETKLYEQKRIKKVIFNLLPGVISCRRKCAKPVLACFCRWNDCAPIARSGSDHQEVIQNESMRFYAPEFTKVVSELKDMPRSRTRKKYVKQRTFNTLKRLNVQLKFSIHVAYLYILILTI